MKRGAVMLLLLLLATAPLPGTAELKLTTGMPEQLPYVYPDLRLILTNPTSRPVFLPKQGFHVNLSLETEDGWRECRPVVVSMPGNPTKVEWEKVSAGDARVLAVPASRCLCRENFSSQPCADWTERPGTYRLRVTLAPYTDVDAPPGALGETLQSNVVEIRVKEPAGLDAEAIAWAKGSPMKVGVLKAFPSSEYAALFWFGNVRLSSMDPDKTRVLVDSGRYPGPNSVPDPSSDTGWRDLDSEGVARWQAQWGERVLREHPQFAYHDEVKLIVALANMSLGNKEEGLRAVGEIAQKQGTAAAVWSGAFLGSTGQRGGS